MWVLTYWDESQELEVTLPGDPHCDAIIINRDKLGFNCQVSWERWLQFRDAEGSEPDQRHLGTLRTHEKLKIPVCVLPPL
jgi:hypothetical protein